MFASFMTDELEKDIKDCLGTVKEWGFRYVDLRNRLFYTSLEDMDTDQVRKLKEYLDSYGMKVGMMHTSIGKVKNPEDPKVMESQLQKAKAIINAAPVLGVSTMRLFPILPTGFKDFGCLNEQNPWWDRVLSINEPVFRLVAEAGLNIAVENGPFHINDALQLVQAFSKYNAGIAWDIMGGWILRDKTEPVDAYFKRLAPWIRNVHVKMFALPGFEHNFEMSDAGKTAGSIPWDKFLAAVRQAGSGGPISVETQQVLILHEAPSISEANRMLSQFVLSIADDK